MKAATDLFELIKSLTKSEKRYFKLFSSLQKGNKNYLNLFDAIESQKVYSEIALKEKFKNERFIKQLTFTKNYLRKLIFKVLMQYNSEEQIESKLNEILSRCKILYDKALFKQYFSALEKGKKLALHCERFNYYLQMLEMEKVITIKMIRPAPDERMLYKQESSAINKINNLARYNLLVANLTRIYREKGRSREQSFHRYLDKILKSPILNSERMALSSRAKEQYFFILQLVSDFKGDMDGMYNYAYKRFEVLQSHPEAFEDLNFNYWQDVLMYLITLEIRMNKLENIEFYRTELLKHSKGTVSDTVDSFLVNSFISLALHLRKKDFTNFEKDVKEIETAFEKYRGKIDSNYQILIYLNIFRVYTVLEDYNNSLKYINLVLNHPQIDVRKDVEWYGRILNLLVHYELKNFTLLEYMIKSTYRFLIRGNKMYKLETLILKFIKRLPHVHNDKELAENLEILQKDMKELKKDPFERNAFLVFDFEGWTIKKINELKKTARA